MAKPILQWKEPKEFQQMAAAGMPFWVGAAIRIFLFVLAIGLGLLLWYGGRSRPNSHSPPFEKVIWMLIAFGLFMAFVAPWLYSLVPRQVRFFDHAINRSGASSAPLWKYADMAGWVILEEPFRDKTLRKLVLVLRKRGLVSIGIAESITREQIAQVFRRQNVQEIADGGAGLYRELFRLRE